MDILEIENQETTLFNKRNVVTVTENEMIQIDGGTTPVCAAAAASSIGCARGIGVLIGGGYALYRYYYRDQVEDGNNN